MGVSDRDDADNVARHLRLNRRQLGAAALEAGSAAAVLGVGALLAPRSARGAGAAGTGSSDAVLTLAAEPGGPPVTARFGDTAAPTRLGMRPRAEPQLGHAGTATRCDLDVAAAQAVVLHVTSLSGGDEVGTLRWAAQTDTDHQGRRIRGPAVVVFDVSGHIELEGDLIFDRPYRWFAGQTAPRAAGGSGGVYVHRRRRRVSASHVIVEHLRFVDGSPRKHDHGALDVGYARRRDLHDILIRNCTLLWGIDETFSITPHFKNKRRVDHVTVVDCLLAEPARIGNSRGYNAFLQRGAHRVEWARNAGFGARARNPGLKEYTSAALVNNLSYDIHAPSARIFKQTDWVDAYPTLQPSGQTLTHVGNVEQEGPSWSSPDSVFVHHYAIDTAALPQSGVRQYFADEWITGAPADYPPRAGHRFLAEPPLWPQRGIMPHEDVEAHVLAHAGAWPGDRSHTERRIMDAWQAGRPLVHDAVDRETVATFPDTPIAATVEAPALPPEPFATEANGLTAIENWLERRHVTVGGAPWQDLDKRLRFPWGGLVSVGSDGWVTFDPEDLGSGEAGELVVELAESPEPVRVRVAVR